MATKIITVHYTVSGTPQTGLAPVIDIWELNPTTPSINTLIVNNGVCVEIGQGWYRYQFTTYDATKNYVFTFDGGPSLLDCERYKTGGNEGYVEEISAGVWDTTAIDHNTTGTTGAYINQINANAASLVISMAAATALVTTLLKYQANRTKVDAFARTLTIYDDDCVTPLKVFDLKDSNGNPSVIEVCERVPDTC